MSEIRVLIVEDEPLIAEDIADYLGSIDYSVSGIAHSIDAALLQLESNCPDIAILDINLGEEKDGIFVAEVIKEKYKIPFVFLTSYADKTTLDRAKHTQPMGYIVKPFDERDLLSTLEIAHFNFFQIQSIGTITMESVNKKIYSPLTKKEFEILLDLRNGKTNKQMAETNFISINTIKTHIKNIYEKLEVHTRSQAVAKLRELT